MFIGLRIFFILIELSDNDTNKCVIFIEKETQALK